MFASPFILTRCTKAEFLLLLNRTFCRGCFLIPEDSHLHLRSRLAETAIQNIGFMIVSYVAPEKPVLTVTVRCGTFAVEPALLSMRVASASAIHPAESP